MNARVKSKPIREDEPQSNLTLGVKGRLTNQEMEQLKQKLAQAVSYDHVANDERVMVRRIKTESLPRPMTKVYRSVQHKDEFGADLSYRPGRKSAASIAYEKQFSDSDSTLMRKSRPLPVGSKIVSGDAKHILQHEYITRPRIVSVIPRNLMVDETRGSDGTVKTSKRLGPPQIPQVFI